MTSDQAEPRNLGVSGATIPSASVSSASVSGTSVPVDHAEPVSKDEAAKKPFLGIKSDPPVFLGALGFIAVFVVATLILGETARDTFTAASGWLTEHFGWLYIGGVSFTFFYLVVIFVSRFGRLRLGDDDEEPEFSFAAWFSMVFAAGVGAVLMFWGVAEPLNHAFNPPMAGYESMSEEAINQAFAFTYYHFGLHMWVILVLPGLALGYFNYKRKMPPRLSSVFSPILGGRIYSWPGKLIDIIAIVGTVFGIGVSVGLGVLQINAGMTKLWGTPQVSWMQLAIIVAITAAACVSVATGLDKGVKILSNLNIGMAVALMAFVFICGPTLQLAKFVTESFGIYADALPGLMFWTDSAGNNPGWHAKWTVFYWAWTVCWSPFVGSFIARISRGRTVREYIGGVLIAPTIFGVIWFGVFGRAGIAMELADPGVLTKPVVEDGDVPQALFGLLAEYPWFWLTGPIALIVIILFFVTSIDSSALVNDMLATGEENHTPTAYRLLWAVAIGLVCAVLLLISPDSGIATLQEVVILISFPVLLVQMVMMFSLAKGMADDSAARGRLRTRQWQKTDTAEKLEAHEAMPAPGYDEEGNERERAILEHDEDGNIVIPGNVVIGGTLGVNGEVAGAEGSQDSDANRVRIVEQSRPRSGEEWDS